MIKTLTNKLTFEEYLACNNGTNNRYELEDGDLILINPPIGLHDLIIRSLRKTLEVKIKHLALSGARLQVLRVRTAFCRSRLLDFYIVSLELKGCIRKWSIKVMRRSNPQFFRS